MIELNHFTLPDLPRLGWLCRGERGLGEFLNTAGSSCDDEDDQCECLCLSQLCRHEEDEDLLDPELLELLESIRVTVHIVRGYKWKVPSHPHLKW